MKFNPDRFLEDTVATRHYFQPFGSGPRMCIGNHFAMLEITVVLAKIVAKMNFKLVTNQRVVPQPLITLKPKYGIQLEIA
jgi:cytochrome P450